MGKLHEKSMFVHLTIRMWQGRRLDKKAGLQIANQNDAKTTAGNYHKRLVAAPELKEIERIANAARATNYHWTLPWLDGGIRILPNVKLGDYMDAMSKHKDEMIEQVEKFIKNYPYYIAAAPEHLGRLFNRNEYPKVQALRRKFEFDVTLQHIADDTDFRIKGADNPMDKMEHAIRVDVWQRIDETMQRLARQLSKDGGIIRQTLVDAVQDLGSTIPALNLTDDPEVHTIMNAMKKNLGDLDRDGLTKDEAYRKRATKHAKALASKSRRMLEDLGVESEEETSAE